MPHPPRDPPPSRVRIAVFAALWLLAPAICAGVLAVHLGMPFWVGVILAYYLAGVTAACLLMLLEPGDDDPG